MILGWIYDLECLIRTYLMKFWFIFISFLKTYFKWHDIKKKRICDPMEKFWIKKELYFEKYEFLKFYTIFFRFLFDF